LVKFTASKSGRNTDGTLKVPEEAKTKPYTDPDPGITGQDRLQLGTWKKLQYPSYLYLNV
jgi:hypothetical protein